MIHNGDDASRTAATEETPGRSAGSPPAKGWGVSQDQEPTQDAPPKRTVWDWFLQLLGVIGPDKRGGPGG